MLLTLLLAVGIPVTYAIIGMYVSRNYWFNTRNMAHGVSYIDCYHCAAVYTHWTVCNKDKIRFRELKTILMAFFWPFLGLISLVSDFYHAPEKKLEQDREALIQEIEGLESSIGAFDSGSLERKTLADIIEEKQLKLEEMR